MIQNLKIMKRTIAVIILTFCTLILNAQSNDKLSLKDIFSNSKYRSDWFGQLRWFDNGTSYTTLDPSKKFPGFLSITKTNSKTSEKEVLVPAEWLIPSGKKEPLKIANYYWTSDNSKLLIFTNTTRVWRLNTKGDYWVLDIKTKVLKKLGGSEATPSTLMFAKFSPEGKRVAYVRNHNIYVEELATNQITQLTFDGREEYKFCSLGRR